MRTSLVTIKNLGSCLQYYIQAMGNGAFDPQFSFITISITRTSHKVSFYGGFGEAITGSQ